MKEKKPDFDQTQIRPYGDTYDDGKIQLSFTLPMPDGPRAEETARHLAREMGLEEPRVYHRCDLGEDCTFFIVYARFTEAIDATEIHAASIDAPERSFEEINDYIREQFGRPITVLGACIGNDAHSVGIDAIMNPKGYRGEYGLERYPMIEGINLGMQVPPDELVREALRRDADALLVSQVVTQNNAHVEELTRLIDILEAEQLRHELLAVCGGPRLSHELALELGYDAGFSSGTTGRDVANYLVVELARRELVDSSADDA